MCHPCIDESTTSFVLLVSFLQLFVQSNLIDQKSRPFLPKFFLFVAAFSLYFFILYCNMSFLTFQYKPSIFVVSSLSIHSSELSFSDRSLIVPRSFNSYFRRLIPAFFITHISSSRSCIACFMLSAPLRNYLCRSIDYYLHALGSNSTSSSDNFFKYLVAKKKTIQ